MQEGDYISFQKASAMLADRLSATREEVALWAWFGKRLGGFDAYVSPMPAPCRKMEGCGDYSPSRCDGFAPPLQYGYPPDRVCDDDKPWTWLADAYFLEHDIESFSPAKAGRYISWNDLLTRWQAYGLDEDEISIKVRGRIHDDELTDIAPLFGGTVIGSETGAPPSWAMFPQADIDAIEVREFSHIRNRLPGADTNGTAGGAVKVGAGETAKRNQWTDVALKALWQESILPGMTQKALAEKYGVTHQSISKQLKRASERFSTTKSKASAKKTWLS
jgi:hypothetical protein